MVLISNAPCPRLEVVWKGRFQTFLSYFSGKQQKDLDDTAEPFAHTHTRLQFQCWVRHAGDTPPPLFVCAGAASSRRGHTHGGPR